jgi:hypothetical protein
MPRDHPYWFFVQREISRNYASEMNLDHSNAKITVPSYVVWSLLLSVEGAVGCLVLSLHKDLWNKETGMPR